MVSMEDRVAVQIDGTFGPEVPSYHGFEIKSIICKNRGGMCWHQNLADPVNGPKSALG